MAHETEQLELELELEHLAYDQLRRLAALRVVLAREHGLMTPAEPRP